MERVPVMSSTIVAIGYDSATQLMEIEFNTGAVYEYSGVPASVHEEFMASASKGQYLHTNIKNGYSYRKL